MKNLKPLSPFKQKGIATIELAIILPLMVFLWIGTIEAGMAFSRYNNLTKAVRDGARHISLNALNGAGVITCLDSSCAAADQAIKLIAYNHTSLTTDSILPDSDKIDVVFTVVGGNNIRTTATYTHNLISGGLVNSFFGTSFPLTLAFTSTVVMRAQ